MSDPGNAAAIRTRGGAPGVERKVLAGFLAALVLMFVAGAFTYRAGAELPDADGALEESVRGRDIEWRIRAEAAAGEAAAFYFTLRKSSGEARAH